MKIHISLLSNTDAEKSPPNRFPFEIGEKMKKQKTRKDGEKRLKNQP
jgi:hypothetical protein